MLITKCSADVNDKEMDNLKRNIKCVFIDCFSY